MRIVLIIAASTIAALATLSCSSVSEETVPIKDKKTVPSNENKPVVNTQSDLPLGQEATDVLVKLSHASNVDVIDTISSLGPLSKKTQTISFRDIVRYHGHPCDGLVIAAAGMAYGLRSFFPAGSVDRTDLIAATNGSPCYGDAAEYITGTRVRYGTLTIDKTLGDEWIIGQRSTNKAIKVSLREGIKPDELVKLEGKLKGLECPADLIRDVQKIQWELSQTMFTTPPEKLFLIEPLDKFPYPVEGNRPDVQKRHCPPTKTINPANR